MLHLSKNTEEEDTIENESETYSNEIDTATSVSAHVSNDTNQVLCMAS